MKYVLKNEKALNTLFNIANDFGKKQYFYNIEDKLSMLNSLQDGDEYFYLECTIGNIENRRKISSNLYIDDFIRSALIKSLVNVIEAEYKKFFQEMPKYLNFNIKIQNKLLEKIDDDILKK